MCLVLKMSFYILKIEIQPLATSSLTLREEDVVKVVPQRIYSTCFRNSDSLFVACGDRQGNIGLWSPDRKSDEDSNNIFVYRPHTLPVSSVLFDTYDTHKMISCGYDGTVRSLDLNDGREARFIQLFACQDKNIFFTSMTMDIEKCIYYVTCDDGGVEAIDPRQKNNVGTVFLHGKKVNTICQHPQNTNVFVTASLDRTVALFDARKFSYSQSRDNARVNTNATLGVLPHKNAVNSASFSPLGDKLVTVGYDNFIHIYDVPNSIGNNSMSNGGVIKSWSIPHNNETGRWVSKFKAAWDPKYPKEGRFVLGSKNQPRCIEIYSVNEKNTIRPKHRLEHELMASIHSVNEFHPTRDVIVGGNSSGRMCLWRS